MLHCSFNNRFALKRSPLRDARLIMFAKADAGEQQTTDATQETAPKKEQGTAVTATIEKNRAETKKDLQNVLESKQTPPPHEELPSEETPSVSGVPGQVGEGIESLRSNLTAAHRKLQETYEWYKDIMPSEFKNKFLKTEAFLSMQLTALTRWSEALAIIAKFKKGEMAPDAFGLWLTENIQKTGIQGEEQKRWKEIMQRLDDMLRQRKKNNPITKLALDKLYGIDVSAMQNPSTRDEIKQEIPALIEETQRIVPFDELNALIQQNVATIEAVFPQEKLNEFYAGVNDIQKKLKDIQDDKTVSQAERQGFFASIGIRFYSAYEIFEAFSMVTKAYQESFKEHTHLKASGLAQSVGNVARFLPFAGDIQQTLDLQLDKANDEVKDGFVNFLKNRRVTFRGLFDPGGELDRNKHDPNRARAVLEYAASRGFLWDIEDSDNRTMIVAEIPLRSILPSQWSEAQKKSYYQGLRSQNASGQQEERKKGETLVASAETIPVIIDEIHREMQKRHFWSAFGMMEVAMKKAKVGHVNPWLTTTIFMEMSKGDTIKYIPKGFIDQIGGLGLGQPGFTMQFFKFDKDSIYAWRERRARGADVPISEAGRIGSLIATIEKEFAGATEEEKAELVAKVLAGQLVKYNGKHFSIFEDKYNTYRRDVVMRAPYVGAPNMQADPDFFGEESEVLLYGPTGIKEILSNSNESAKYLDKAENFLRTVLERYDKLDEAGQTDPKMAQAAKEFQEDMQEKFEEYMRSGTINATRAPWPKLQVRTKKSGAGKELAFKGLIDRKLIRKSVLEELIDDETNPGTKSGVFQSILKQVDSQNPRLQKKEKKP
ncbi:hypothetical protein A2635_02650 [Candidatus Peribacteria bacterium RIFCSPHIGHO2_01_FULL_51_9]|nr:MAG: hypothetical protein A2635_02650 [Candidatus Peribacteria bacterium RIFCSPHIGHO2_01_FULL_51_9]